MIALVTGAAGFIGSNFIHYLFDNQTDADCLVIGLDKLTYAGNFENLASIQGSTNNLRFEFVKGDIRHRRQMEELFKAFQVDIVFNFAAESHVDRSIESATDFVQTNVAGTQVLLDVCRRAWKTGAGFKEHCKFIQISTDEVYGSLGHEGAFTESTPLAPNNPYAASKAAADLLVMACHHTHGLPAIVTRCSNNYGPYQFPEKLIPLMIRNALLHEKLPVYGDGLQVRDWLFVRDHCAALERVCRQGAVGQVYHIGGNCERRNLDLVKVLLRLLREKTGDEQIDESLIQHVADRPGHDRRYAMNAGKIRRELDWVPLTDLETGLAQTVDWYLAHRDWTERVISGEYLRFYEKNYAGR